MFAAFSASQQTPTGDALEALAVLTKLTAVEIRDFFTRKRAMEKQKQKKAAAKAEASGNAAGASVTAATAAAPEPAAAAADPGGA